MQAKSSIRILTIDLSFRNAGYNVTDFICKDSVFELKPIREFTLTTKPEPGTKEDLVYNITKNFNKLQNDFDALFRDTEPDIVLIEFPFGSQSSAAAMLQGLCYGIIAGMEYTSIPIFLVHPNDVKKWCCGKVKNCDKEQIKKKALTYFPELLEQKPSEHIIDSYAILLSQIEQPNLTLSHVYLK